MSAHEPSFRVEAEPDSPRLRHLVAIGVVGIVITVVSCLIVLWWLPARFTISAAFHGPAPAEIATVDQTLIWENRAAPRLFDQQREQLDGYGWVDRDKGLVRIPVDKAMDLVVEEAGR